MGKVGHGVVGEMLRHPRVPYNLVKPMKVPFHIRPKV